MNEIYLGNLQETSSVAHLYRSQNDIGKIYCIFAPGYKTNALL